ncbi:MAG: mechanosensitive ion channel domain-containing protein [Saprospiraceae bacterium]
MGFNITILLAGSAALLVGLGLGIQNLFSDYISGIIILFDSSIKVGDIIEINNIVGKVQEIKLRTSLVLTRDDRYIIIPNTELTKSPIINWTHYDISARFSISVGVAYHSDVHLVKSLILQAVKENEHVLQTPEPFVRFDDFGDSALQFNVFFWAHDVFRVENIKGQIRESITQKFRNNAVEIPFPQRVVHQR